MMQEAIENAEQTATQFAENSKSKIDKIMDADQNHRSAAEVMANAARVVKAAVNIVRAAIAGGLHGAAAAAAKELLPTIIKFAVGKSSFAALANDHQVCRRRSHCHHRDTAG